MSPSSYRSRNQFISRIQKNDHGRNSAPRTTLAVPGAPVSCDRAYAQVMTDSSEVQFKKMQVLPHPHDLGYPLGYSKSSRCYASSCQVVDPNGLDPLCGSQHRSMPPLTGL
ncbi:hypothetical protein PoB_000642000 [Plakobranchus ocellatus]|uniref:Uncharacterized protein n=1 Tax=Plakobranchus ocellatus TaxID=259542 RepID=A0AAV3YBP4_9GAST|nr:hypothetical protein PoB_000642000 [Plakobranchus ocellatus]